MMVNDQYTLYNRRKSSIFVSMCGDFIINTCVPEACISITEVGRHRTALFWKNITTGAYEACRVLGSVINETLTQLNLNTPVSEVLLPRSAELARRRAALEKRGSRGSYKS